ncbi:MAG TPA: NUMOD1 domain-containing DNA-binding protein [Massilibacterium sp.]|nr:NUMOD1 domain-containing DNA-binding protein [Massilibacterium sp.]
MTIYTILNTVNDKAYIGQTIQDYKKRKYSHMYALKRDKHYNQHLQNDWNKYGEDVFEFKILECRDKNIDELNDSEDFWIRTLNTITPNGYNSVYGGRNTERKLKNEIYQYDLDGNFIKSWVNVTTASIKTDISLRNIFGALSGEQNSAGGYQWFYIKKEIVDKVLSPNELVAVKTRKKVVKYSLDGDILKVYNSCNEASLDNNICKQSITIACRLKSKTAAGFQWRYFSDNIPELPPIEQNNIINRGGHKKKVYKYSKEKVFLAVYESVKEAMENEDVSRYTIQETALGRQKTGKGYIWSYKKLH